MSFTKFHYSEKCPSCNTSTSPQPGVTGDTSGHASGIGACLGSGDAGKEDECEDKTTTQECGQLNLACAPLSQNTSSSGTPNTVQSDSSTPRSDGGSNDSDSQKKPDLPSDSLCQYLQQEKESKPLVTLGQFPLHDRSIVGQENLSISGMSSGAPTSTTSSSSLGGTAELAPKERRRWVRPPLIGQAASSTEVKIIADESQPSGEEDPLLDDSGAKLNELGSFASSETSESKHENLKNSSSNESANYSSLSKSIETGDSTDENFPQTSFQTSIDGEQGILSDSCIGGKASPSSSIASHKRLEWDSGADVGYYQSTAESSKTSILKLSAIERLALTQNTDKASRMRLDPEGTSASVPSTGNNPTPTFNTYPLTLQHSIGEPSAESTPIERASSFKGQRKSGSLGISAITMVDLSKKACPGNNPVQEFKEMVEAETLTPRQRSLSVCHTRSASLLNLPTAVTDPTNYLYLCRSHSDPDFSADAGAYTDDSFSVKFSPRKFIKGKGLDTRSLSSGSEKTLVHGPEGGREQEARAVVTDHVSRHETNKHLELSRILKTHEFPQSFGSASKGYSCSDNDHRQGRHHHYGVLCSSCLVIPSELAPRNPTRHETYNPQESHSRSVNSSQSSKSHSVHSDSGGRGQRIGRKGMPHDMVPTQEKATSVTPPSDETRERTSACVGKATSFEYLPGRIYESEMAAMRSNIPSQQEQLSQPQSSASSSVSSGQNSVKHQVVRQSKHKSVTTSSGDSEDALWSSPRISSGTLVRDLERGVNLLRGLVPHSSHNTAAQRDLVRRVVQRLVSSEYTDDLLEKKIRRQNRRPLSGGHTFEVHHLPSVSERTQSEQRVKSAHHRNSRKVQSLGTLRGPTKTYVETGTQPSDTVSSSATDSSSLRSTSGSEVQKAAIESTVNRGTIQEPNDSQKETQPPSQSFNPASQPSNPTSRQSSNPASGQPSNPASGQPSNPASQQPSNPVSRQSSNPASEQPSSHSTNQRSNHSTQVGSPLKDPSVANAAPVTSNPVTTDASTTANQELRATVSYGTLSSVVSITPSVITVQSSPAVPMREANSEIPVATKATANAATMTSPPTSFAEPPTSAAEPPAANSAPVSDLREVQGSYDERRKMKSASSQTRQLQLINCEISHLRNLEKMLKKHPHIVISSPLERPAPLNPSVYRKAKVADCPTSEEHLERQRRPRDLNRGQDDHLEKASGSVLKKVSHPVSSADCTTTSSVLSSSTLASNFATDCYACSAPVTTSREATKENKPPRRLQPAEKSRKQREPSPESEDSVTRAVTQAVSSRVKALRNLGQIEEAEVKIRVRMGQPSDAEGPSAPRPMIDPTPKISISQARPARFEEDDFDSKRAELDELIARQRAMDAQARKKLQLLNEMRENALRRASELKTTAAQQRDACTLTSVDNATNTSPMNSATHVPHSEIPVNSSSSSAPQSSRQSCPACRVRASAKKPPENEPMCRHDPGFTAGQPRGRQRLPMAYFLKVEEEQVVVRPKAPPRVPSLQVVTVKVPRPVRPPSSIGSSGSLSSSSSRHSPVESPVMSPKPKGHMTSSVPTFGHDSRSSPESRKKRSPRKPVRRDVTTSRSEPRLGRGDADKHVVDYSSDEHTATGTLQDCLTSNFPEYIQAAERRRQFIHEMSYLRRLRQESRKRLVQLDGDAWVTRQKQARSQKPSTAPAKPAPKPKPSMRSMRVSAAKKFARMPEIEQKRLELKKKEENRTNRLFKEIYTTKLREKVLRGETTLRSSVSVISSF